MPASLTLDLTDAERRTLEAARTRHDQPHVRERAAALLKIANGWSGRAVATKGLLQERATDTVYTWYHDWIDHGLAALYIDVEAKRGRKPAFSP